MSFCINKNCVPVSCFCRFSYYCFAAFFSTYFSSTTTTYICDFFNFLFEIIFFFFYIHITYIFTTKVEKKTFFINNTDMNSFMRSNYINFARVGICRVQNLLSYGWWMQGRVCIFCIWGNTCFISRECHVEVSLFFSLFLWTESDGEYRQRERIKHDPCDIITHVKITRVIGDVGFCVWIYYMYCI